jgi:hypothetical protein
VSTFLIFIFCWNVYGLGVTVYKARDDKDRDKKETPAYLYGLAVALHTLIAGWAMYLWARL